MRRRRACVLTIVVLLAACADDDAADSPGALPAAATPAAPESTSGEPATTAPAATEPLATAPATPESVTAEPSTTDPVDLEPGTTDPATTETARTDATTTAAGPVAADDYPDQPADVPFPTAEWPVGDLPADVDRAAVDSAVDRAFGAADAAARVKSVVIVQGGRIVYERYHPLDGPDVVHSSFSVGKSFTSAIIGLLVDDGRLSLDEHPPVEQWQAPGDPRQDITLRHLLQMSSGLEWTEAYGPEDLAIQVLTAPSAADRMAEQPLEAPPGTQFEYSTGTSALIAGIAADELGGCDELDAFVHERLLDPLGITTDQLDEDAGGCYVGGTGADMTTRDFARFGLLYLRGGQWDGSQLLSSDWIDATREPAPTMPDYGLHWWVAEDGSRFAAEGLFGQRIVVIPGRDMVIAVNSTQGGDPYTMVDAIVSAFGG